MIKIDYDLQPHEEAEDHDGPWCPFCNGQGEPLGTLGDLEHYRCRNCGAQFYREGDAS